MEKQNKNQDMEIENNFQDIKELKTKSNLIQMEEEENLKPNKPQNQKIFQTTKSSSELNCSIRTNYSNNPTSLEQSLNSTNNSSNFKSIQIFQVQKPNTDYLFNLEYLNDIYINLLLEENKLFYRINQDYMDKQNDINYKMRAILVDWLIEVHYRFHFKRKTLFQTIYIIDLYLSQKTILKTQLQLLGIASLLISCKANEVYYPRIEEYVNITSNAYTKAELLNMEMDIMKTLNFEILSPTPEEFFNILSKVFNLNEMQHHFGEYFLDSALLDYKLLKYKPSTIAVSCTYIVMKYFKLNNYKELYMPKITMIENPQKTIKDCARDLCFLVKNVSNSSLRAAKEKYSSEEFENVAALGD